MKASLPTKVCAKCKQSLPETTEYFPWVAEHTTKNGSRTKFVKAHFYPYCWDCERQRGRAKYAAKCRANGKEPRKVYPVVDGHKTCSKCGENQSISEYQWQPKRRQYGTHCKSCRRVKDAAKRRAAGMNPRRTYPVIDGYKTCSACGQSLPATEDHFFRRKDRGQYFSRCKTCLKPGRAAYSSEYRSREGYTEYQREWRQQNPERTRAYESRWLLKPGNYDSVLVRNSRRRATQRGVTVEKVPRNIKAQLRDAQGNGCHWCRRDLKRVRVHLDHFYPIVPKPGERQGSHSVDNLVLTCQHCNDTKSNLQPEAFAQRIGLLFAPDPPFKKRLPSL